VYTVVIAAFSNIDIYSVLLRSDFIISTIVLTAGRAGLGVIDSARCCRPRITCPKQQRQMEHDVSSAHWAIQPCTARPAPSRHRRRDR